MPPTHDEVYWLRQIATALGAGGESIPVSGSGIGGGGGGGGGGTQYTDGAVAAAPIGTAAMWRDASNIIRVAGRAFPLPTQTLDIAPATGTISAPDTASTSAVGAGGQNLITGAPSASSTVIQTFSGNSSFAIQITGTITAGALLFERSIDGGVTYNNVGAYAAGTNSSLQSTTTPGIFHGNASSCTNVRVRANAAFAGNVTALVYSGEGVGTITLGSAIRGLYSLSPAALNDGASTPIRTDAYGNQTNNMQSRLDIINDAVTAADYGYTTTVVTTAATTVIKNGAGVIKSIRVLGGTLGNVTVYDNTAGSGTVLVPTVTPIVGQELTASAQFSIGTTIVTAAATLLVITWR